MGGLVGLPQPFTASSVSRSEPWSHISSHGTLALIIRDITNAKRIVSLPIKF